MNDPRRPSRSDQAPQGFEPTEQLRQPYPADTDPAYAGQAPYGPAYGPTDFPPAASSPTEPNPTGGLPQYWQQGQPPPGEPPQADTPAPEGPKSPRWLWIAAGAAVLLVVALVIALVIANGSAKKQTAVPGSTGTASPSPSGKPATTPTETTSGAALQTVVYDVTGEGRAISITYEDTGGVRQIEFNVALPWNKEVSLSAQETASVAIVNIGHNVTCSVTVAGVQVGQHTGVGLTVCSAAG